MFRRNRTESAKKADAATHTGGLDRLDIPVYLDNGVALSLSASLNQGLVFEKNVETESGRERSAGISARAGALQVAELGGNIGGSRSIVVTENEVRKQTQESIFNAVRCSLETEGLIAEPGTPWASANWRVGEFVDFSFGQVVVPLVSALSRLKVIADAFSYATSELSVGSLQEKIPLLLAEMKKGLPEQDQGDDYDVDQFLSFITEAGELARALSAVIGRIEEEASLSGLVDIVMFEGKAKPPGVIAVASLDRDYVDTKLLRRLGQGTFSVLGKVIRTPQPGTALNAFRNSMFGATNQFPVLLTQFSDLLYRFPLVLGDGVNVGDDEESIYLDFAGSASAISELKPLWVFPSVELFPIAIYA